MKSSELAANVLEPVSVEIAAPFVAVVTLDRPPVNALELRAPRPLARPQGAAAAQLGVVEAVDVVGDADQQVQVEGPVLAVLEGPEAV